MITPTSPAAGVSDPHAPVAGSTRPKPQPKRYGRRRAFESAQGTYLTVMPCRDCGAVVAYAEQAKHDAFHQQLRRLLGP